MSYLQYAKPPQPQPLPNSFHSPWVRLYAPTWRQFLKHSSTSPRLTPSELDEYITFFGDHHRTICRLWADWFVPLLNSLDGILILCRNFHLLDPTETFFNYHFCIHYVLHLQRAFFFPEMVEKEKTSFDLLLRLHQSDSIISEAGLIGKYGPTLCCFYNAIALFISQQPIPPNTSLNSKIPQPLNYDTDFVEHFDGFRYALSKFTPVQSHGNSFSTDLTVSIARPFVSKPSTTVPTSDILPFTATSASQNTLVNSYHECLYYQSTAATETSSPRPLYIQFEDCSGSEHPVLKIKSTSMSDSDVIKTEDYLLFFLWMFVLSDSDGFIDLVNRLSTQQNTQLYNQVSSHLSSIFEATENFLRSSPSLAYQLQVFNYRLYLLQQALSIKPTIHPFPSHHETSLLDPILWSLPTDSTPSLSHVFDNQKHVNLDAYRKHLPALLVSMIPTSTDVFFNNWVLQHFYRHHSCDQFPTYTLDSVDHDEQTVFLRNLIEVSYQQYRDNRPTLYQHIHSRSLETRYQYTSRDDQRCDRMLSFVLIQPFFLFHTDYQLLQKHILLCAHSSLLNRNVSTDLPPQLNRTQDISDFDCHGLHRVLIPFSAMVYAWLMASSGLITYFPSPRGEGLSNLMYHVYTANRYRCSSKYFYSESCISTLPPQQFTGIALSNPIDLVKNPLLDESDPIIKQIKSMVVDTDGRIWFVTLHDDQTSFTTPQQTPTTEQIVTSPEPLAKPHRKPQWGESVTTFQFNEPFVHATPVELFTQSRAGLVQDDFDFDFYATAACGLANTVISRTNAGFEAYGYSTLTEPWEPEHTAKFLEFFDAEREQFFNYAVHQSLPPEVDDIHPYLDEVVRETCVGPPVNLNRDFPDHRFENQSNLAEHRLINSAENQRIVNAPEMIPIKKKYRRYLHHLHHAESELVADGLRTVLCTADAAGLFDSEPSSKQFQKSYPFPPPTPLPASVSPDYTFSRNTPTHPDVLQYNAHFSKWCVEMLLVSSLHLQPFLFIQDLHHQPTQQRPDRPTLDATQPHCTPQLIAKVTAGFANSEPNRRAFVSTLVAPIPPAWIIRLNRSTDPWFMFDSLLSMTVSTTLQSAHTLFSLHDIHSK